MRALHLRVPEGVLNIEMTVSPQGLKYPSPGLTAVFFCFTFPLRHSRCKRKHTVFDLISFPPQGTNCTATDMGIHRDYLEILSDDDRIDFRSLHILSSPSDSRIQKLYECMSFSSTPSPRSRHHGNRHSHLLLPRRAHGQHPLQISARTCRN